MNKQVYRYYTTQRPPVPGAIPTVSSDNIKLVNIESYTSRRFVESINRMAWGYVGYSAPLTDEQIKDYELVPEVD